MSDSDLVTRCIRCKVFEYHKPGGVHGIAGYLCPQCIAAEIGKVAPCPCCGAARGKDLRALNASRSIE